MEGDSKLNGDTARCVDSVIEAFLDARDQGQQPDPQQWMNLYPECAEELADFFACHDQCLELIHPLRQIVAPQPRMLLGAGDTFGNYELLEEIGRGGMGVVFKARQTSLNRIVAVKMILAGRLASTSELERFYNEARAAAGLAHSNVVAIHEVGEHGGLHYYSMDYVEGQTLAKLVRDNPLPARQAAEFLATIADAVQYSHEHGIIHRDLKPSNVLIDRNGQVHVTDFGLARWTTQDSDLTTTGAMIGTPGYMSPEQALGRNDEPTPQMDVYSLGATLYELLAGRPPFRGADAMETLKLLTEAEPVSLRVLAPSTPIDLETICLKCLQKSPDQRYATARQLSEDLQRFLRFEPILARPVARLEKARRWCIRNPARAGLIAAIVLIVTTALGWGLRELHAQRFARAQLSEILVSNAETLAQRGDWRAALANLDRARQVGHADPLKVDLAQIRALVALSSNTYADQLEALSRRDDLGDHAATIYMQHGMSLATRGKQQAALEMLKRAIALGTLQPGDAEIAQAMLSENSPDFIRHLERAVSIDPLAHNAQAFLVAGLMMSGRIDEGIRRAEIASALFPESPTFPMGLATLAALGREPQRIDEYLRMPACRQYTAEALDSYRIILDGMVRAGKFFAVGWDIDIKFEEYEAMRMREANFIPRIIEARKHFSGPGAFALRNVDLSGWSTIYLGKLNVARQNQALAAENQGLVPPEAMVDLVGTSGIPCISRAFEPLRDVVSLRTYGFLMTGKGDTERIDRLIDQCAKSAKIHPEGFFRYTRARLQYARGRVAQAADDYAQSASLPNMLPALAVDAATCAARCYFELYKKGQTNALAQARQFMRKRLGSGPIGARHAEILEPIAFAAGDYEAARKLLTYLEQAHDRSWIAMRRAEIELADGQFLEAVKFARDVAADSNSSERAKKIQTDAVDRARDRADAVKKAAN